MVSFTLHRFRAFVLQDGAKFSIVERQSDRCENSKESAVYYSTDVDDRRAVFSFETQSQRYNATRNF